MKRLILAFLFGLFCGTPALAAPLYDNLAYGSGNGDPLSQLGPLSDSFSTGTDPFSFSSLKLSLAAPNETDGGAISVSLFANSGNAPGAVIAALGSILNSSLNANFQVIDLSFAPIALAANTRYWITVSGTGSGQWEYATGDDGVGIIGEFWDNNSGGPFVNSDNEPPYVMAIAPVTGAPEPLTLSLLGAGVIGMVLLYRRRRTH
jgi:hypothetical protein